MNVFELEKVQERELAPGFFARMVHSGNMTFAYWRILEGSGLPAHSHPHEQVVNLLEGTFELTVAGESRVLVPGNDVVVVPPNAPHSGRALTPCRILDVFYPVREDYR
ncbi:MAG: cupin domain-containing protein [Synergistales bacterium]|jgi:quercetin dioxygenase-like cupin family protein